jgi:hypothetical protein
MKIALLGTQPDSISFAPFKDTSWEIWACSPGLIKVPRSEVWFDLHYYQEHYRDGEDDWFAFLAKHPKVYMQRVEPEIPNSVAYPIAEMRAKYGPYFWNSTLSYMAALAIEAKPEAIGIWGVDMAANGEYAHQRLGCQYFIQKAKDAGIEIVIPSESDLLEPLPMYGYREGNRRWRKLNARLNGLRQRHDELRAARMAQVKEEALLDGAIEDVEYTLMTFPND